MKHALCWDIVSKHKRRPVQRCTKGVPLAPSVNLRRHDRLIAEMLSYRCISADVYEYMDIPLIGSHTPSRLLV